MAMIDLPFDILEDIFLYLGARDFLALTSTCKRFHDNLYDDSGYWRHATVGTFRIRNRPSVPNDGDLWRNLYRRLLTQTSIYTWGQASSTGEPEEKYKHKRPGADYLHDYGIVSDLQCGGWSTVFLNHRGELFLEGQIDGEHIRHTDLNHSFDRLKLPEDTPAESAVIRQFSAGRQHILGLADDGTVWLWFAARKHALKITFLDRYIEEARNAGTASGISRVVAGWNASSVYIRGKGIVTWIYKSPLRRWETDQMDATWNQVSCTVAPRSSYITSKAPTSAGTLDIKDDDDADPGEVTNHVLLDNYIVFCTDKGKAFATFFDCPDSWELRELNDVVDVQGAFQSLAFFLRDGSVITTKNGSTHLMRRPAERSLGDTLYLAAIASNFYSQHAGLVPDEAHPEVYLQRIPALQSSGVIQIAFGDYHYHALHSNGKITSYGRESDGCGALGLGRSSNFCSSRGVIKGPGDHDLALLSYYRGRAVWLDPGQIQWAKNMDQAILGAFTRAPPLVAWNGIGEATEWIEQQISDGWDQQALASQNLYFGLSVAAGGWRGGAVVLVPEGPPIVPSLTTVPNIRLSSNELLVSNTAEEVPWKRPPPEEFQRVSLVNLETAAVGLALNANAFDLQPALDTNAFDLQPAMEETA